jgi:threonine aldolase
MISTSVAHKSQQVAWKAPPPLDLRYEVTHKPTPEMWEAMMRVTPGMASARQDPVVDELESLVATMTGKEAALFLPTTTNGTVLALMHSDLRAKRVVMEARCHMYWVEQLHVSHLSGAAPLLVRGDKFGAMDPEEVEAAINETAYGYTHPTGMICLENTHNVCGGTVLDGEYTRRMSALAHQYGAELFLDGARVFNAAVALGVPVKELASPADHVVVSLNKGLGAPLGGVLCSSEKFIEGVRALAKRTGMISIHKAGLFAAAGIIAVQKMYHGLEDDHRRARRLATELAEMDGLEVDLDTVQTNLFRVGTAASGLTALDLAHRVAAHGLGIHVLEPYAFKMSLCYAIDDAQVEQAVGIFRQVMADIRR